MITASRGQREAVSLIFSWQISGFGFFRLAEDAGVGQDGDEGGIGNDQKCAEAERELKVERLEGAAGDGEGPDDEADRRGDQDRGLRLGKDPDEDHETEREDGDQGERERGGFHKADARQVETGRLGGELVIEVLDGGLERGFLVLPFSSPAVFGPGDGFELIEFHDSSFRWVKPKKLTDDLNQR